MASTINFSDVDTVARPALGSMPKEYRDVCNILIDNGWAYVPPRTKNAKPKIYPPDRSKRTVTIPITPSNSEGFVQWLSWLRRSGAMLDEHGNSLYPERDPRYVIGQSDDELMAAVADKIDPDLNPVLTHGAWWRSDAAQTEIPLEAPEPVVERRYAPRPMTPPRPVLDPWATGAKGYTLTQAITLLNQGYHVNKVIAKTGWGRNHFANLIDQAGYVALDQ